MALLQGKRCIKILRHQVPQTHLHCYTNNENYVKQLCMHHSSPINHNRVYNMKMTEKQQCKML